MNKLQAVNKMLRKILQRPVNSLQGNLSVRVVIAKSVLEDTLEDVQLTGYYFNTEREYPLYANQDGEIYLSDNILSVDIYSENEYVQHGQKLYDKTNHTYKINQSLTAIVVKRLEFESIPPIAQNYIVMKATNEFITEVKLSQDLYAYSANAVNEAKAKLEQLEIETGKFNILDGLDLRRGL
jgi:hypothetical protein